MANITIDIKDGNADGVYPVELGADSVNTADITDDAVTGAKILDATVAAADLAANAVETAKIKDANVTLAKLAAGIAPSHVVKFAGTHAYAGGGTSDAATVTGVAATDIVVASIKAKTNASYLDLVVPTTNTITFTFSADPGASTEVFYTVYSAAA